MELYHDPKFNKDKKTENKSLNLRKSVKSQFIRKKIFSILNGKRKLNIIKYNKKYINELEITIDYFKKVSGKYKIDGINGKGKEILLASNIIVFEREYLYGKKKRKRKRI